MPLCDLTECTESTDRLNAKKGLSVFLRAFCDITKGRVTENAVQRQLKFTWDTHCACVLVNKVFVKLDALPVLLESHLNEKVVSFKKKKIQLRGQRARTKKKKTTKTTFTLSDATA